MKLVAASQARPEPPPQAIGEIVSISGTRARVLMEELSSSIPLDDHIRPHVGTLLTVDTGGTVVLCLITGMSMGGSESAPDVFGVRVVDVEMIGELVREKDGYLRTLRRGVSVYPRLGDLVCEPTRNMLEKAYYFGDFDAIEIGSIHQDPTIPAVIKIDEMLGKHFAIVGSTGTGKSCTVALLLRAFLDKQPNSHIMLIDPHNEYTTCFDDKAHIVDFETLCLPYWFLNFEELIEVVLGGPDGNEAEVELLREFIPAAKRQYSANRGRESRLLQRSIVRRERYSVDVPVPYRLSDLIALITEQMGYLENQKDLKPFKKLKGRIETLSQDPRYGFMFGKLTIEDNLSDILKQIFRIPINGKPITIVQLVGLPSEIVNVVVSILARLAFDLALWSDGKMPITFVCEEAHRYVPRDKEAGFEPTKRTIARIAKEGRKYGVSLSIVSQRPGDIDPTILSQCSTIFAMRLSNEADQNIIKAAVSDGAESMLRFLPSLGNRETIAFGEGVPLPSRVRMAELPESALPKDARRFLDDDAADMEDGSFVDSAVQRWRSLGTDIQPLVLPDADEPTAQESVAQEIPPNVGSRIRKKPAPALSDTTSWPRHGNGNGPHPQF